MCFLESAGMRKGEKILESTLGHIPSYFHSLPQFSHLLNGNSWSSCKHGKIKMGNIFESPQV